MKATVTLTLSQNDISSYYLVSCPFQTTTSSWGKNINRMRKVIASAPKNNRFGTIKNRYICYSRKI